MWNAIIFDKIWVWLKIESPSKLILKLIIKYWMLAALVYTPLTLDKCWTLFATPGSACKTPSSGLAPGRRLGRCPGPSLKLREANPKAGVKFAAKLKSTHWSQINHEVFHVITWIERTFEMWIKMYFNVFYNHVPLTLYDHDSSLKIQGGYVGG